MSEHIKDIHSADFTAEVLRADLPVVVDFWAPWCAPCRYLGPMLEKAVAGYVGRVKAVKINVDNNQDIAGKYGISGIPTLLFFHGGELVRTQVGVPHPSQLDDLLRQHALRRAA